MKKRLCVALCLILLAGCLPARDLLAGGLFAGCLPAGSLLAGNLPAGDLFASLPAGSLLAGCLPAHADAPAPGTVLYIAPGGSDAAEGTIDAPLGSLAGARDKIRALKAQAGGQPEGGVTVYARGGTYNVTQTAFFDETDSGTAEAPVRYAAYPGETPVFSGGSYIPGRAFAPVTDETMRARLSPDARERAVCYDLFANGFTADELDVAKDFWREGNLRECVTDAYSDNYYIAPRMQVFVDDEALHLARYPNRVPGIFADNPYDQYLMLHEIAETGFDAQTEQPNGEKCAFRSYESRIKNWASYEDVVIVGMLGWEFFQSEVVAENIDPQSMTVTLRATPTSGVAERGRYAFANVFEELDAPGEFYIDKASGVLYLYPPKDMRDASVKISRLETPYMVDVRNASHLSFDGLSFELTKGSVFWVRGGSDCAIENCTLKNFGINGVRMGDWVIALRDVAAVYGTEEFERYLDERSVADNGVNLRISGCAFLNTGYSAAQIASGNSARRQSGGAVFENNTVKHSGLIGSCYNSGVVLNGCGITVRNNTFAYCRGQAINGNVVDTQIIYNEFLDSPCDMAEDTCTIYLNYMGQNDGVQIRYNYFHDITNRGHHNIGFDYARRAVAGYDNAQPFRDFSYNVVYNVPCIYSNPMSPLSPSTTLGNVFIDCDYVLDYPDEYIRDYYQGETGRQLIENVNTLPLYSTNGLYKDEMWRALYPEHYEFYEYMANEKTDLRPVMSQVCDNLIVYLQKRMSGRASELPAELPVDAKYGRVENNRFVFYEDPGFADIGRYDFQLSRETASAFGMQWLDMAAIGAPGFEPPARVNDAYEDARRWTPAVKAINVAVPDGEQLVAVSLWRLISPGVWEWQMDAPIVGEQAAWFPVRPGGTYTAFFHGDKLHAPQFMGGGIGEAPPEGVQTFSVGNDPFRFEIFTFDLTARE